MSDVDSIDRPETGEALPIGSVSNDAPSRERWMAALWAEGEAALVAVIEHALAQGLGIAQVDRLTLLGGSCNDCPIDRLIRVRLDGEASLLAEPTPRAVIEAGLSLLRAKGDV